MLGTLLKGSLGLISMIYPKAAPIISLIEKAAPYLEKAQPIIAAGIKEGPGAYAAAKEAAPELFDAIDKLTAHVMSSGEASFGSTPEAMKENVTRAMFALPQMTFEEELKWMNDTTKYVGDPRFGG
jgi:hypothetical protein